jgi:hypothetical protein
VVIPLQAVNRWVPLPAKPEAAGEAPALTLDEMAAAAVVADAAKFNADTTTREAASAIPLLVQNRVPGYDPSLSDKELYQLDVAQRPDEVWFGLGWPCDVNGWLTSLVAAGF